MSNPFGISKKFRKFLAVSAMSSLLAVLLLVGEAKAADGWTIASTEGAVTVNGQVAGSPAPTVGPGTVIETGADGKVVLTRPGDNITVYPNSRMSVPVASDGEEAGILQTLGRLMFRMESRESRDFEVKTPYLAAAIKGTTFAVDVNNDAAEVDVSEGSVLVTANRSGNSAYVGPGQRAVVGDGRGDSVSVSALRDDDNDSDESREGGDGDERGDGEHDSSSESGQSSDDSTSSVGETDH